MIDESLVQKIESIVKKETMNSPSVIHNFYHIKRVAIGSKWFASFFSASAEEKRICYIAGLLHDVVRPAKMGDHASLSAERSRQILTELNVDKDAVETIVWAVKNHSNLKDVANRQWKSLAEQCVFLADKILEIWGAYIVFRRSMYVGECKNYEGMDKIEALLDHHTHWLNLLTPKDFPLFKQLAEYQYQWMYDFVKSLQNSEDWAVDLATRLYDAGKEKKDMDKTIRSFLPEGEKQKHFHNEAVAYLDGKKFPEFEKMVKIETD